MGHVVLHTGNIPLIYVWCLVSDNSEPIMMSIAQWMPVTNVLFGLNTVFSEQFNLTISLWHTTIVENSRILAGETFLENMYTRVESSDHEKFLTASNVTVSDASVMAMALWRIGILRKDLCKLSMDLLLLGPHCLRGFGIYISELWREIVDEYRTGMVWLNTNDDVQRTILMNACPQKLSLEQRLTTKNNGALLTGFWQISSNQNSIISPDWQSRWYEATIGCLLLAEDTIWLG